MGVYRLRDRHGRNLRTRGVVDRMIWLDLIDGGAWEDEWEEFDWWGAE